MSMHPDEKTDVLKDTCWCCYQPPNATMAVFWSSW